MEMEKENADPALEGEEYGQYSSFLDNPDVRLTPDQSTPDISPVKRKKIDEDGFVTPTTPDIPKTSIHSAMLGLENKHQSSTAHSSVMSLPSKERTEDTYSQHSGDMACVEGEPQPGFETGFHAPEDEPHQVESESRLTDIGELVCHFGQEAKQYHVLMSEHFRNSASFEEFVPQRVDKILKDALQLEQQLVEQKERLKGRLQMLGQTLHTE